MTDLLLAAGLTSEFGAAEVKGMSTYRDDAAALLDATEQTLVVDDETGIVEAIVSVTNIVDSVDDIIMPGAYGKALRRRRPKVCFNHEWRTPVGKVLDIAELMPGDHRLPPRLKALGAGALWVKTRFNLNTQSGRDAYENVKFYAESNEAEWSIGYNANGAQAKTRRNNLGQREIHEFDALYEVSPVLFGAAPFTETLSVKSLCPSCEGDPTQPCTDCHDHDAKALDADESKLFGRRAGRRAFDEATARRDRAGRFNEVDEAGAPGGNAGRVVVADAGMPFVPPTAVGGKPKPKQVKPGKPTRTDNVEEAVRLLSEGKPVELRQTREVSTLLDRLAAIVADAREKGEEAPTYDLCKVSVKGTNLFCVDSARDADGNKIPRIKMPQLSGKPAKGSKADNLDKNAKGEVDLSDRFREHLRAKGVDVSDGEVPAANLRASQNELLGNKVAGMAKSYEAGTLPRGRIFTSADDYIVDGHHRWAAMVGVDAKDGKLGDVNIDVARIDMDIIGLLAEANRFAAEWGIPQASVEQGKVWQGIIESKRAFSQAQRDRAAESGAAMDDGSFPISNADDLANAVQAVGRAKDPDAARRHIVKRAKALGLTGRLPEGWGAGGKAEGDPWTSLEAVAADRTEWKPKMRAAGVGVIAADTGRILLLQRCNDPDDPAGGCWELPGGCLDEGEDPFDAAAREFAEEIGVELPDGDLVGEFDSPDGVYRYHLYRIASEDDLRINLSSEDRDVVNPG